MSATIDTMKLLFWSCLSVTYGSAQNNSKKKEEHKRRTVNMKFCLFDVLQISVGQSYTASKRVARSRTKSQVGNTSEWQSREWNNDER